MTSLLRRKGVRFGLGVVALVAVAFALFRTWDEAQSQVLPNAEILVIASVLVVGGLAGAGRSWFALFEKGSSRRLVSDFYLAQLGKYLPGGGIWQAAGQVGLSAARDVSTVRVSINLGVHAVIQLSAAVTLGGFLVFASNLSPWLRVLCGAGFISPLILHRSWMAALLRSAGSWLRLDTKQAVPPDQRSIIRSWLWSLLPIAAFGVAYGVMVNSLQPELDIWQTAAAFAMAWAVGFALVPFPAGLGVREVALVVLVGGPTAIVVAASIALRLIAIGSDVLLASVTSRIRG